MLAKEAEAGGHTCSEGACPHVPVTYQVIIVIVMVIQGHRLDSHVRIVLYKFIFFFIKLNSMRFL